jgi:hypothetical protein
MEQQVDLVDDANSIADQMLDVAITNARSKGRALSPKGSCHFCEEKTTIKGQLFCDIDCSDDYEKLQRKIRHRPE